MNIHEYQGKSLLKGFGVAIQEGIVADTPAQAAGSGVPGTAVRHTCLAVEVADPVPLPYHSGVVRSVD